MGRHLQRQSNRHIEQRRGTHPKNKTTKRHFSSLLTHPLREKSWLPSPNEDNHLNRNFKTLIDEDGFVRLPIRIHGPRKRSIKLIGIVDTASSYTIIPPFACQLLNLPLFDKQTPEIKVLTGSGYIQAPLKKATQIEILGSQIRKTKHTCPLPPHPKRRNHPRTHLPKRLRGNIQLEEKDIHIGRKNNLLKNTFCYLTRALANY